MLLHSVGSKFHQHCSGFSELDCFQTPNLWTRSILSIIALASLLHSSSTSMTPPIAFPSLLSGIPSTRRGLSLQYTVLFQFVALYLQCSYLLPQGCYLVIPPPFHKCLAMNYFYFQILDNGSFNFKKSFIRQVSNKYPSQNQTHYYPFMLSVIGSS